MVERITDPHNSGGMTFPGGRVPDGQAGPFGVPQPPPAEPDPEPAPTSYEWRVFWMGLAVVLLGVVIGAVR